MKASNIIESMAQGIPNGQSQAPTLKHMLKNYSVAFRRWESTHIPDLKFIETSEHNVAYGSHLHDFMEIIWVNKGSCEIISHGCRYTLKSGDVCIIPPNEVHAGGSPGTHFSFTGLHIPRALLFTLFGPNYEQDYQSLQVAPVLIMNGRAADALYHDLIGGLPNTSSVEDQLTCLKDVLGKLFQIKNTAALPGLSVTDRHPAVTRVKSIIDADFTEPVDLRHLASEVNLHQRYLISLFKAITGIPPHQYQIALRVEHGRCLLDGNQSLSSVACSAGFADQSHFNRHFKRVYRLTPGMFREQTVPMSMS